MSIPEDWLPALQNSKVQRFIRENENKDIYALSLKQSKVDGISMKLIAPQIKSRQKAKSKLPEWYAHSGIVFPPPENLEQASSEATAKYKATLLNGEKLLDLTGGTGIDTYYLSSNFEETTYIEPNPELCLLAQHNFDVLGQSINVINLDALGYLSESTSASAVYIDPSRRVGENRINVMQEYAPDITQVLPHIPVEVPVLIKLSPMLDIRRTLKDISSVSQVHIVAVEGEVKELLILVERTNTAETEITSVNLTSKGLVKQLFRFHPSEEETSRPELSECKHYLYEANAAVRKSGGHKILAERFGLKKLGLHTHLYTSDTYIPEFPGRAFEVTYNLPYLPNKLKKGLGLKKANLQTRNFPEEVVGIRSRLKLGDGGDTYLFFYTDLHGKLRVAGGPKASQATHKEK